VLALARPARALRHVKRDAERVVLAVTGLAWEARIAAGPGVRTLAGAVDARDLAARLEREAVHACAIVSFGVAGGLAADLAAGTCVIARAIVTRDARWPCDDAWTRAMRERIDGAVFGDIAGSDRTLAAPADKRAWRAATQALTVDNESHVVAQVAAAHRLPFAAVRVVVDPAQRLLPPAALVALRPHGRIDHARVLRSVARRPSQLPLLVRTALDARTALRALRRARSRLGARFGFAEPGDLSLDVA
jgi:adenosylhomocysteine nucleosidase